MRTLDYVAGPGAPPVPLTTAEVLALLEGQVGIIARTRYEAGANGALKSSTASADFEDVDATNAKIDLVVPASGKVLIRTSILGGVATASKYGYLNLREGSSNVAGSDQRVTHWAGTGTGDFPRIIHTALLEGLTPGAEKTYKLGIKVDSPATFALYTGPDYGPLIIDAHALNL